MTYMMHWMYGSTAWAVGLAIAWFVFVGIVAAVAFRLTRIATRRAGHRESARDILDKRYAHGEIDRREYETRRDVLRHSGSYRPHHGPI
jgi:uncharacterized membrane protein